MKRSLLFTTILTLFIAGCNKSETTTPTQQDYNGTTIPLSEALSNLDNLLDQLDIDTKASHSRTYSIKSVSDFGGQDICKTKATGIDIPDTLMYLVNFDDSEGFAVLAGDRRLSENVYCITENGNISKEDFADAFDYLHSDSPLTKSNKREKGEFIDIGQKFVPTLMLSSMLADLKYGKIIEDESAKTKAKIRPDGVICLKTKWKQGSPFSDNCPNRYPAGCVAIACAQIVQYCRLPKNPVFNGVACSWDLMETVCNINDVAGTNATKEAKYQVANFINHVGNYENCRIEYGATGSSGNASGAVRTLKNYGFKDVKKYLGFRTKNQNRASSMIGAKLPIYIDGSDYHHGGGHAWVLDGDWNGYFHCNWGWNGKWDGFYAKHNYFPVDAREYTAYEDPGTTDPVLAQKDYDWDFSIITYMVH